MTDTFRDICAQLAELHEPVAGLRKLGQRLSQLYELASRARAALAVEVVGPSDEELLELAEQYRSDGLIDLYSARDFARSQ